MSIASILTKQKIPNIAKPVKGRTDRWHPATIQDILKNKQLIGTFTGTDPETPNFFPAVIPASDFYAVQAILKTRYNYKGQNNHNPQPFTRLLTCSRCGESVVKICTNRYKYLQCSGARIHTCKQTHIRYHPVETALLKAIYAAGPGVLSIDDNSAIEAQKQLDALQGRIAELQSKIDESSALFIATPSEAGAKILQRLEADKINLMKQLEDARNSAFLVDHRADWREVKARVEAELEKAGKIPWEVIPVSVKMRHSKLDFLRHRLTYNPEDALALRETIRRCVDKIVVDISNERATISFSSGRTAYVELSHTATYPRRYSCRYTFDNLSTLAAAAWIPIDGAPSN
jgi:hypothetical protein